MAFYGDPDELDRIAARIEQRADDVRKHGSDMVAQAGAMRWKSIAADRCRETIAEDRKSLDGTAAKLDAAAAALRRHAQELRELIAAIKRIGEAVVNWFTSAIDRFNQALESFKNMVNDMVDTVTGVFGGGGSPPSPPRPPWEGWRYQPHNLPPAGDRQWLEVGEFMNSRGVAA